MLCLRFCLLRSDKSPSYDGDPYQKRFWIFLETMEGGSFASKEDGGEAKILQYGGHDHWCFAVGFSQFKLSLTPKGSLLAVTTPSSMIQKCPYSIVPVVPFVFMFRVELHSFLIHKKITRSSQINRVGFILGFWGMTFREQRGALYSWKVLQDQYTLLGTNHSRTSCCFQVFGHGGSHRHDLDTMERAGGFWDWCLQGVSSWIAWWRPSRYFMLCDEMNTCSTVML